MVTPQFEGPDLFEERDVERPHPGPGEILVRVFAAGTNPVDAKLRAAGGSAGLEAPIILGADISGVVEEVGLRASSLANYPSLGSRPGTPRVPSSIAATVRRVNRHDRRRQ